MQADFHYYATYCAAYLAGYSHEEALVICYSDQFVDCCTKTFLKTISASVHAATSQTQAELLDMRTDVVNLQDITRIWSSFHFLPKDLYADIPRTTKTYRNKYRLICGPNGDLVKDTVELAKGKSLQHTGIAMHVLADTWAHQRFAGTPSLAINNTDDSFYEIMFDGTARKISFKHSPGAEDDIENAKYNSTVFNASEYSILNLGHGHAGHLPDYSFIKYKYLPAWDNYRECLKDNPSDYRMAFCQMIYAMKYLRGDVGVFETETYDEDAIKAYEEKIMSILTKRQQDASSDWKDFARELSGYDIPDFDVSAYAGEYKLSGNNDKNDTFLGKFILAALSQKSMVTNKIYTSGNTLAGFSVDYSRHGFGGIKDYFMLVNAGRRNRS
ncbi:hypothetical protein SAMN02910264_01365 [Ruminococcaceae bacterium YAD3003]|nr:hypothetical protein SAMN02910264_01365 [Ruminococcaceae bacterium YAD3003]